MLQQQQTQRDVQHWLPRSWQDIAGNSGLKSYCQDLIWGTRMRGETSGYNALIRGPSRSGKSSIVKFTVRAIGCQNLAPDTLQPCDNCRHCHEKHHICGNDWDLQGAILDVMENRAEVLYRYMPIDCSRVTESELDEVIHTVRQDDGRLKVVFLDEVHRLSRRAMDERLLVAMDDYPAIWIASTAEPEFKRENCTGLDPMFCNRFSFRLQTETPGVDELMEWLAARCREFHIRVETPESTLRELAERSEHLPGLALHVLNRASKSRHRQLNRQMVEDHDFL
jgi:Holliday junction resolvasome RuvABC ATP-dependent DNA helicase subunit